METIKIQEVAEAVNGELCLKGKIDSIEDVCIDSRKAKQGDLFIPIKGEKFDGHTFLKQVVESGVTSILVEKGNNYYDELVSTKYFENNYINIIEVCDTRSAIKDLAQFYIKKLGTKVVGITGSVGKTTTKDMVASVLAKKYKVLKTQGNFNNEIGLPLTVFKLDKSYSIAVLEMGMSNLGEINALANIARPETAVISNVGVSHIENLKSRENILKAKMEITNYFNEKNILYVNGDNDMLNKLHNEKHKFNVTYFGIENQQNAVTAVDIKELGEEGIEFKIKFNGKIYDARLNVIGIHNVYNALAAFCVGLNYNIEADLVLEGIKEFIPSAMRQEIINNENYNIKIINDVYNASTTSMKSSLDVLKAVNGKRKIAVLGDMLELGHISEEEHKKVGKFVLDINADFLITKGAMARYIGIGAIEAGYKKENIFSFDSNEECIKCLKKLLKKGDSVLVKGSRGMKMEVVVNFLKEMLD